MRSTMRTMPFADQLGLLHSPSTRPHPPVPRQMLERRIDSAGQWPGSFSLPRSISRPVCARRPLERVLAAGLVCRPATEWRFQLQSLRQPVERPERAPTSGQVAPARSCPFGTTQVGNRLQKGRGQIKGADQGPGSQGPNLTLLQMVLYAPNGSTVGTGIRRSAVSRDLPGDRR